jgi:hypothetical protein
MGLRWAIIFFVCIFFAADSNAVIFYTTGDPTYNTNAPTGVLTNSGWQYQGQWGSFLGTVIAPRYFITAKHVEGAVGQTFRFAGQDYATVASYTCPDSDLRIWRVCGSFPIWADLYTNHNEVGLPIVVMGRGTQRGDPVIVNSATKGWYLGPGDAVQRWGQNTVSAVVEAGAGLGQLLSASFDSTGNSNEVYLSIGDSGGGVFMQQTGVWKLAGINFAVDGPFNTTNTGDGFFGAIYDENGLYVKNGSTWELQRHHVPSYFYVTRISTNVTWIQSVLNQAPLVEPILQVSSLVTGPYTDASGATVDTNAMTITYPYSAITNQFFRLRACTAFQITNTTLNSTDVVLSYNPQ